MSPWWFKRPKSKPTEEIRLPPHFQFLGDQGGAPARVLKDRLVEFFEQDSRVLAAYLARVDVGGQISVFLCLKTTSGPDRGLVDEIAAIFKTIFDATVHLDIMFPNPAQEAELKIVCRPFFGDSGAVA